jgi:hypothetical protein
MVRTVLVSVMAVLIFGDLAGAAEIEEMEVDLAIDPNGKSMTVLVDECAHQWNAYHVQLPNYLAEGVSELSEH